MSRQFTQKEREKANKHEEMVDLTTIRIIHLKTRYQFSLTRFFCLFVFLIYLFLAALGLRCCARAFSSCGEWGLLFIAVCGLLIVVASLVAEHRL